MSCFYNCPPGWAIRIWSVDRDRRVNRRWPRSLGKLVIDLTNVAHRTMQSLQSTNRYALDYLPSRHHGRHLTTLTLHHAIGFLRPAWRRRVFLQRWYASPGPSRPRSAPRSVPPGPAPLPDVLGSRRKIPRSNLSASAMSITCPRAVTRNKGCRPWKIFPEACRRITSFDSTARFGCPAPSDTRRKGPVVSPAVLFTNVRDMSSGRPAESMVNALPQKRHCSM